MIASSNRARGGPTVHHGDTSPIATGTPLRTLVDGDVPMEQRAGL